MLYSSERAFNAVKIHEKSDLYGTVFRDHSELDFFIQNNQIKAGDVFYVQEGPALYECIEREQGSADYEKIDSIILSYRY